MAQIYGGKGDSKPKPSRVENTKTVNEIHVTGKKEIVW
jgi:hypothetical protein